MIRLRRAIAKMGFLKALIAFMIFATFVTNTFPDYDPNTFILGTAIILAGAVAHKD